MSKLAGPAPHRNAERRHDQRQIWLRNSQVVIELLAVGIFQYPHWPRLEKVLELLEGIAVAVLNVLREVGSAQPQCPCNTATVQGNTRCCACRAARYPSSCFPRQSWSAVSPWPCPQPAAVARDQLALL